MSFIDDWKRKLNEELLEIEKRDDLTADQKANRVRHVTSAVSAGVAVQPIPFADIFVLTPIQALGGLKISRIRGLEFSEKGVGEVIKEIWKMAKKQGQEEGRARENKTAFIKTSHLTVIKSLVIGSIPLYRADTVCLSRRWRFFVNNSERL